VTPFRLHFKFLREYLIFSGLLPKSDYQFVPSPNSHFPHHIESWLLVPFLECLVGGLSYFKGLRNGGPPGSPLRSSGENSGGERHHPSVTPLNEQAGSLGMEEKASAASDWHHVSFWMTPR
jgi:hypothetical protein